MAGSETRRHIGDAARKLKDGTRGQMDHLMTAIKDGAGDLGAAIDAGRDEFRRNAEKSSLDKAHV
jgi:hypothetical protein